MNLLIAGSRSINDYSILCDVMDTNNLMPQYIISGNAIGADRLGERWALEHNIKVLKFKPDWDRWGRANAGKIRNTTMVNIADAAVILWDGYSTGTKDTIEKCKKKGIPIYYS